MSLHVPDRVELAEDVCALPLVRRVAAMLDLDPAGFRDGDPLPRGWHVTLFTVPTRQSELRPDGVAGLGVTLPDLGLPRLMMGGKRARFIRDLLIGDTLRRASRIVSIVPKEGRSGRFVIVTMCQEISSVRGTEPVLVEEQDYVMREAAAEGAPASPPSAPATRREARYEREVTPDEALLFRYCAITFNTHRIHYDQPYATAGEGYPALVVNGGLPVLMLVELFKASAARSPEAVTSRNVGPLFCGRPIRLCAEPGDGEWRLWAEDAAGAIAVEVTIR
jgi:3-methylfumaryl-CoA hydratase